MDACAKVRFVLDRRRWRTAPPPVLAGDGVNVTSTGTNNFSNVGADLASMGDGHGTVDAASTRTPCPTNRGLDAEQTLELDTLTQPAT
jgi:hypothetical protein